VLSAGQRVLSADQRVLSAGRRSPSVAADLADNPVTEPEAEPTSIDPNQSVDPNQTD